MKIGIDASNIRTGGGKNHLLKFMNFSLELDKNISFILVSNKKINDEFANNARVVCITNSFLNSFNFFSFISQLFFSKKYFKSNNCDFVFVPGGIFLSSFRPFYTMSQNMLPFDLKELRGFSYFNKLKFRIVRFLQTFTFRKSNGIIFLTDYAKEKIQISTGIYNKSRVIPHGIIQQINNNYTYANKAFNILYVSDFLPYKHNFNVVKAVSELILDGVDIELNLVGRKDKKEHIKIKKLINSNFLFKEKIKILGLLDYNQVVKYYKKCTLFLFASTCENLPFIVLEAMSFGLPIISSDKQPMNNIINGEDVFFNSYDTNSIKKAILNNMTQEKLLNLSKKNFTSSKQYTWRNNVINTLEFFYENKN